MADAFLHLSVWDRREPLSVAADRLGRPAYVLEAVNLSDEDLAGLRAYMNPPDVEWPAG
jgi:hypothetical protein